MPASSVNYSTFYCGVSLMHLILYSSCFEHRFLQPYLLSHWERIKSFFDNRPSRYQGTSRHKEIELLPVHLREEAYLTLACTTVQRVRTAAGVLVGNLRKIHLQDLPSFL
jgi:hypothetical protein